MFWKERSCILLRSIKFITYVSHWCCLIASVDEQTLLSYGQSELFSQLQPSHLTWRLQDNLILMDLSHYPLKVLEDSLLHLFTREFSVTFEK